MSFLKEFKEDLSMAVNELLPQEEASAENPFQDKDFSKGRKEQEKPKSQEKKLKDSKIKEMNRPKDLSKKTAGTAEGEPAAYIRSAEARATVRAPQRTTENKVQPLFPEETKARTVVSYEPKKEEPLRTASAQDSQREIVEEEETMDKMMENVEKDLADFDLSQMAAVNEGEAAAERKPEPKRTSETATITAGTRIRGDIESDGSLEILGTITGNVTCNGKLTITGTIVGDSNAEEIYADSAKVEGQINSAGAVKIGLGSVILGNVNATSAVIAGAVRGDIDVHGPVIVDTSAVVMGNIKSRSVQINNGAVIEGFCSQCYSDISVKNFFDENKPSESKK
jgi:cytoskeletal protein CcmA (bactofilin family)